MSKRDPELLLSDILVSAQSIIDYTLGYNYEQFLEDRKTIDAVIRNFEIIGEAANRLSIDIKVEIPEVEWNKIRGFRNRLYMTILG
ncbi:HepT-like ribonuclease domain-containing protein [Mucilaginibacter polytrichastri]|uniref:UPF0331 protein MJ n=1 Tax=Mucilaginibacter polytrichastri TaxID=1302689 RepID=A0A1Q5ZTB3_9SPHI|nr:HepT-like ribonuclease domain-containing protein [Mucilaginibacter polytrichastri]OKS85001.1 UPF0331 protein MJ [Mucilaginibacter polytrichastri]SFS46305.1 Protein of unknown function DUF86 [Mucilaginibacter polytrichastri]